MWRKPMFNQHSFLYVEDDQFSRDVMRILMENALGVQKLFVLESSDRFLERLLELPVKPDVIFLDIHVKPIDGFTMLKMLRADPMHQHSKMIALTASVMNEEVAKLRLAGF